jgi:hypothetical protein
MKLKHTKLKKTNENYQHTCFFKSFFLTSEKYPKPIVTKQITLHVMWVVLFYFEIFQKKKKKK